MKCKKAKKNTQPGEKPAPVKTHLRDAIVMPEMVGNFVAVYNGKSFNNVEIKFDMIGRYLGEFSLSYKPTRHGKAGVGATKGSAHTSLKWSFNNISTVIYPYPSLHASSLLYKHKIPACSIIFPINEFIKRKYE